MLAPTPEIRVHFPVHFHPRLKTAAMMPVIGRRDLRHNVTFRRLNRMKLARALDREFGIGSPLQAILKNLAAARVTNNDRRRSALHLKVLCRLRIEREPDDEDRKSVVSGK